MTFQLLHVVDGLFSWQGQYLVTPLRTAASKNSRFSNCCRMQLRGATKQANGDLFRFIRQKGLGDEERTGENTNYIGTCLF